MSQLDEHESCSTRNGLPTHNEVSDDAVYEMLNQGSTPLMSNHGRNLRQARFHSGHRVVLGRSGPVSEYEGEHSRSWEPKRSDRDKYHPRISSHIHQQLDTNSGRLL